MAPSTMKGISFKPGGTENLKYEDVPFPKLQDGQVLIEVYATALNGADLLQRAGNYPPPSGFAQLPAMPDQAFCMQTRGVIML